MIESESSATSQPAAETQQNSDEGKGQNISAEQLVARMLQGSKPKEETHVQEAEAAPEDKSDATVSEEAADTESKPEPEAEEASEEVLKTDEEAAPEEGEDDDVLSQKSTLDPETKARIGKRIGKEVAKRKVLETQLTEAQAKAAELEKKLAEQKPEVREVVIPTADDPLADVNSIDELSKRFNAAKQAVREAKDLLDRDDIDQGVEIGGKTYTKSDIKQYLRSAERDLEDHIPARARFLQEREKARQAAYQEMPFLKDKNAPEYQLVQKAMQDFPWLARVPNAEYIVGLAIEGEKALNAKKAAASKPAAKPVAKPPASVSAPSLAADKPKTAGVKKDADIDAQIAKLKSGKVTAEVAAKISLLHSQKSR